LGKFSLNELRDIAKSIFKRGVEAVDPTKRLKNLLKIEGNHLFIKAERDFERDFDLSLFRRIFIIGSGKASASMAKAIEDILGERITGGIVLTKYGHTLPLKKAELIEAGHPIPDKNGFEGSKKVKKLLSESDEGDMIIFLQGVLLLFSQCHLVI